MLFNSYEFILIFLPLTLSGYFFLNRLRRHTFSLLFLTLASLLFYSYWDVAYLPLLLSSIMFNYWAGRWILKTNSVIAVSIAITGNLMVLGYYKYFSFFIQTLQLNISNPEITLPLGVSFFTFTQIAYLVDTYRGETRKYRFVDYCLFVTIFPHLIAGPILYHKDIIPQFTRMRNYLFNHKNMAIGTAYFSFGLFKKVILADFFSPFVKSTFDSAVGVDLVVAWMGVLAYTLQIFLDFSGYSDMAGGLGLMLNIRIPVNFSSPYKATSIIDFWRRWHITLSMFLKHYLYIPLGGNRGGKVLRFRNILITMLLGGLWHGANWTFIVWGGLHGIYLSINHLWKQMELPMPKVIAHLLTMISVMIAWVFFRSNSVVDAIRIIKTLLGLSIDNSVFQQIKIGLTAINLIANGDLTKIIIVGLALFFSFIIDTQQILSKFQPTLPWAILVSIIIIISVLNLGNVSEFLYFQF